MSNIPIDDRAKTAVKARWAKRKHLTALLGIGVSYGITTKDHRIGRDDPPRGSGRGGTKMRNQREADLSPHCEAWLRAAGFTPYAEIPILGRCMDWIGVKGNSLRCVEMKVGLTAKVLYQAKICQLITPDTWCFVGCRPRSLAVAEQNSIGVAWFDGEKIIEELQPVDKYPHDHYVHRQHALDRIAGREPGGISGLPTQRGHGPAQDCFDAIRRYRIEHPNASWREIFQALPHHYANPRSMQGAMRVVEKVREIEDAIQCAAMSLQEPSGVNVTVATSEKKP